MSLGAGLSGNGGFSTTSSAVQTFTAGLALPAAAGSQGPPTTGAHVLGEIQTDSFGVAWICTIAGTPGNWVCMSPGSTIDYLEGVTTINSSATTLATAQDVGLQIAPYSTGLDPIVFRVQAVLTNGSGFSAGTTNAILSVCDVTGSVTPATTNEIVRLTASNQTSGVTPPMILERRLTPPSGSRTVKAFLWSSSAALTATLSGAVTQPASLWARWG